MNYSEAIASCMFFHCWSEAVCSKHRVLRICWCNKLPWCRWSMWLEMDRIQFEQRKALVSVCILSVYSNACPIWI